MIEIHGHIEPGFDAVGEALARSFAEHGEVGASLAIVVDGRPKVDIWAGHMDRDRRRPWQRDTIANMYSTTKGIVAIAAAMLVDRGQLDIDAPVVTYWPEFGESGKDTIPVRWLLTHQAGLPVIDEELPPGGALDWPTVIRALERQVPVWTPGTAMGYHGVTYGWLVGEVIRRITGKSAGTFVRDEIAGPLGVDLFLGTPASEDPRIADLLAAPQTGAAGVLDPASLIARALNSIAPRFAADVNSRAWRAAEIPAANGHGNARAIARLYGAIARGGEIDGVRLLGKPAIDRFATEAISGVDEVIGISVRRGLGFILSSRGGRYHWGPNPRTFGHSGAGGSLGFADPDAGLGFGYVMNQMASGLSADPRWPGLIAAVYDCL